MGESYGWMGKLPWNGEGEKALIEWTAQPPYDGIIKGNYYKAEKTFQGRWGDKGHTGTLEVVVDDEGTIILAEFNEITMGNYYVRYFQNMSKRRSEYGFFQDYHDKRRAFAYHQVLANGMRFVEKQIYEKQNLRSEFELLTGASFSMGNLLPLTQDIADQIEEQGADKVRYYGIAKNFGYGLTGWLQVHIREGKIIKCFYDEILADYSDEIVHDDLKPYFRQSKYHSLGFSEPYPTGWDREAWLGSFATLSDMLNDHVVTNQNLLDLSGLPYVEGEELGEIWGQPKKQIAELVSAVDALTPLERPRYPAWNNYLDLATSLTKIIEEDQA